MKAVGGGSGKLNTINPHLTVVSKPILEKDVKSTTKFLF
jgi:hypothetical protein